MNEQSTTEERNPMAVRATYRYEGGPLDGRIVHHAVLPENPAEPRLHHLTTCAKDSNTDRAAQGLYHLEKRPLPPLPLPLPPEPPKGASEETKARMFMARAKAKEVLAAAAGDEWVAVHRPSEQDKDWHDYVAPTPEPPEPPKASSRKNRTIKVPDHLPISKRIARFVAAKKAMEEGTKLKDSE